MKDVFDSAFDRASPIVLKKQREVNRTDAQLMNQDLGAFLPVLPEETGLGNGTGISGGQ
jgi:hypothetical protein